MNAKLGPGWHGLAEGLRREMASLPGRPTARFGIDYSGLLEFTVEGPDRRRDDVHELVRNYQERALQTCERCGRQGRVRFGVVVTITCDDCMVS